MKAIYLNCVLCQHNWWQKVDETKLVDAPCRCDVKIDMEAVEGRYGFEVIDVLQTITKPLDSFNRVKHKITAADMKIA